MLFLEEVQHCLGRFVGALLLFPPARQPVLHGLGSQLKVCVFSTKRCSELPAWRGSGLGQCE
jgi:hypothetical protein